ncbi:MAG: hypothetical protein ABI599_17915 [Flavobacteriales bacterium]
MLAYLMFACAPAKQEHAPPFTEQDEGDVLPHSAACSIHAPFILHCKEGGRIMAMNADGTLRIRMVVSQFDTAAHRIEQSEFGVDKIDYLDVLGTDGSMPVNGVDSLIVMFGECLIDIPREKITDMYDMSASCHDSYFRMDSIGPDSFVLAIDGGDGAGAFRAKYSIQDGKFQGRTV